MSSKDNITKIDLESVPSAEGMSIHIAFSEWNKAITGKLLKGALAVLIAKGLREADISIMKVPGTFELPVAAKSLLKHKTADAVICLGCVIKGETEHDLFINQSVANALNQLAIASTKPMIFGVLTVNSMEQAEDRAGGKYGNKGEEAAITAIKMVAAQKDLCKPAKTIGF